MPELEQTHTTARPPIPNPVTARAVRAFLHRIEGRYPVRDIILFGSRARGTHTAESDADLAVVLSGSGSRDERGDVSGEMAEIAFDVLMEAGLLVQAFPVWEEEMRHPDRFENPALLANILRDGVRL